MKNVRYEVSKKDKEKAIQNLLTQAPPGEFINSFDDLSLLVEDEKLMRRHGEWAGNKYCKKYFVPLNIDGHQVLLAHHNELGDQRFFDSHTRLSFKFDVLENQLKDIESHGVLRNEAECLRMVVSYALKIYVSKHFPSGNCNVLRKTIRGKEFLIACIEDHHYKASDYWNGLWKSKWIFSITPFLTQVIGSIYVKAHFFKQVNFHLDINKDVQDCLDVVNQAQLAVSFAKFVEEQENKFQTAVLQELQDLEVSLKRILRRDLPVTRTHIDWQRIVNDMKLVMYPRLGYVNYSKNALCHWIT
ncbi:F-actin-capping protein subunit alpha-3 [Dromiciops gliroides]|uniref:F-actin-capping protein subunit alpha-3 n=1 Tax=Dromiciops gliroides TaxID=33562 RepID=UPI001CC3D063|nr:F-actin-capping protein subunit alpha-3 [Dromiciops gliroides]